MVNLKYLQVNAIVQIQGKKNIQSFRSPFFQHPPQSLSVVNIIIDSDKTLLNVPVVGGAIVTIDSGDDPGVTMSPNRLENVHYLKDTQKEYKTSYEILPQ